jgi:PAS domain S-box-containing protein
LGKDAFEALLPDFNRVLAGEKVHYERETNFRAIGQRWISATYTPTLDPNEITDGWVAVVIDVTERRRAEQALCESEERLRLAAKAGRMFAYSWDAATDVIERSGESAEILGVEQKAAATGSAISAMVYPADKERLGAALAKLSIDNPRLQITYRMVRPDGAVIWLERNSCAYFDERGKIKRIIGMVLDVTKRRRAEEALRRSEERLRLAQWAARIGTFDLNLRTGVDIWTPETEALYGLPPGGFAGTLTAFENLIHPDDREKVIELTREMMKTGQPAEGEWRVIWPDGSVHWIASRGQVLMDESGKPSRMLGVNMDVTERKLAEDKLREYERAVENAEDMIGVIDRQYRFLLANRQYLKMRNLTREQVVGHFVADVLNKEIFETEVKPKLDECFQGKVVRYEMKFSYPSVGERDLLLSYFPIEGVNGVDRVACILHDITDRKRAEVALLEMNRTLEAQGSLLRSREELLKIFVKNTPAGVAMFDRDMRYLQVSDRWCTDYSVDSAQIQGRSHYELFPDLPQHWKEMHRRGLEGETLQAEDRWDREHGTKWVRWEIRPWFNIDGVPGGILIFAEDITHRKQTEEALSGMTGKLVEAQEQERARIARELHDDINQRLAVLAIECDRLRERNDLPSEVRGYAHKLKELAADISSRVYAVSHQLHSSTLDVLGLVKGMRGWCKEFGNQQKLEIDFKSDNVPSVPQQISLCLFRVLQEALHNAAKHSGVKRIEVRLVKHSSEIHLTVRDSGRGFDIGAASQSRGLGLTSMKERVRLAGGTIGIESKPRGGTTIHVRVPLESKHHSQRTAV